MVSSSDGVNPYDMDDYFVEEIQQRRIQDFLWGSGGNSTDEEDFTSNLLPASDVSVDAVVTSIYLNALAFVVIMATYECLRRLLPAVYSSRTKRRIRKNGLVVSDRPSEPEPNSSTHEESPLPDVVSFNWVPAVLSVPWSKVRQLAGLDGYFFLRYIRMNVRICAVSSVWAICVLVPTYATGEYQTGAEGWYKYSVSNVVNGSHKMWVPAIFAYFFTGFIFFVMKQEYRHFMELRMEFLARGGKNIHPQHHYSLMVENIPYELRSDKALKDYFEKLFPGKVHSASVVLNLPDLEALNTKCLRVCRRLEKSIAYYRATGERATHRVGSPRVNLLGIDLAPCDGSCRSDPDALYIDGRKQAPKPKRGTLVDSISYYTHDLAECNKDTYFMQRRKAQIASSGATSIEADTWLARVIEAAYDMADRIMVESAEDNALNASSVSMDKSSSAIPQAELMTSRYGSFGPLADVSPRIAQGRPKAYRLAREPPLSALYGEPLVQSDSDENGGVTPETTRRTKFLSEDLIEKAERAEMKLRPPGMTYHSNWCRRMAGRLGLDFIVAGLKFFNRQIDHALETVVGATMSSTGFVTFLDLTSVTCAVSTPLTAKPQILHVNVAPEPRDLIWGNAHISGKNCARREQFVNICVALGVFFWIFPLAAIQLFAKAEYLARIPGMEWILTFDGGSVSSFVNGYLPVVALLCLILLLPVMFEFVARKYERRKTFSDVQRSMLGRYFFYQLVNIYITVTAGSIWKSLAEILDHPSNLLELLGESLPYMVGYFVALLVTKILAGLPIVFLRVGALSRMLLMRALSSNAKLTQRELDQIYRPENVQYGWEFPSQLLVILIVFTYAIICPVILPVGLLYFMGSMVVYKKQVLYVYQPVYESGGAMFPAAVQRTLFGLVCGQLTLIGYLSTRGLLYQPLFLLPLPACTIWGMGYFHRHYAEPSTKLSLERAREYDRVSEVMATATANETQGLAGQMENAVFGIEARKAQFDKDSYRQPSLSTGAMMPAPYRRGYLDDLTKEAQKVLLDLHQMALVEEAAAPSHENDSVQDHSI